VVVPLSLTPGPALIVCLWPDRAGQCCGTNWGRHRSVMLVNCSGELKLGWAFNSSWRLGCCCNNLQERRSLEAVR
jgi:hypothetical protein